MSGYKCLHIIYVLYLTSACRRYDIKWLLKVINSSQSIEHLPGGYFTLPCETQHELCTDRTTDLS